MDNTLKGAFAQDAEEKSKVIQQQLLLQKQILMRGGKLITINIVIIH
ncbi:MAG: hypothetical protein ABIE03_06390 [Patescibacteria group bacterium]|nr:hypothetical protein [Patescibacteria group bacterium]